MIQARSGRKETYHNLSQRFKVTEHCEEHDQQISLGVQPFGIAVGLHLGCDTVNFNLVHQLYYLSEHWLSRIFYTFAHKFELFCLATTKLQTLGIIRWGCPLFYGLKAIRLSDSSDYI